MKGNASGGRWLGLVAGMYGTSTQDDVSGESSYREGPPSNQARLAGDKMIRTLPNPTIVTTAHNFSNKL